MKPAIVISYDSSIPGEFFDDAVRDAAESDTDIEVQSRDVGPMAALEWVVATSVIVLLMKPFLDAFLKRAADDVANAAYPKMKASITRLACKVLIGTRQTWVRVTHSGPLPRTGHSSFFSIQVEISGSRRVRFVFDEGQDESTYSKCVSNAFGLLEAHYAGCEPDPFTHAPVDDRRKTVLMIYNEKLDQWQAIDLNEEIRRIANESRQRRQGHDDSK
jgi:hypothetical protein